MTEKSKIYFVSDAHLGFPNAKESLLRERLLVELLQKMAIDAKEIILLGDIFDFWFEYKKVVPRGFTRLMGTLGLLTDQGITIRFFKGNHDMWTFGYLEKECGVIIHHGKHKTEYFGKKFFIAHGDGLGPGDKGYKRLKRVFNSKFMQWFFARFHPNFSFTIAQKWSFSSRLSDTVEDYTFQGEENERLLHYARRKLKKEPFDFFVFGHRHVPLLIDMDNGAKYVSLGDWLHHFTYAEFDGNIMKLNVYPHAAE
ncbi:MAG: UDP-2,3-diacylglucosamine hydrolase [Bacteroidetes bacterium HGW-Bacteroidetes-21]|nr:MAG: UDP-2,3-diacylglucosamine hydrolase [Bacteroidetes bacterium HGW-Bacteroidetes-21]